jgi:hypothetical protein
MAFNSTDVMPMTMSQDADGPVRRAIAENTL